MIFLFENFAESRLVIQLSMAADTIVLPPSDAAKWPKPQTDQQRASAVLYDGVQSPEIVWVVTNPGTGTITVERGMEGTSAKVWRAGTVAINTPTKVSLSYLSSGGSDSWHQELLDMVNEAYARISEEYTLRLTSEEAFAQRLSTVEAGYQDSNAAVQVLSQAFADINSAWANYQVDVTAQVDDAVAKAGQALNTSVENGEATAELRTFVETAVGDNAASFAEKITAFTNFDTAQVTKNEEFETRVGDTESSLTEEITLRSTQYETQAGINTSLNSRVGDNTAAITTETGTRVSETAALATRASTIEAEIIGARGGQPTMSARINSVESTSVAADTALATRATNLEATVGTSPTTGLRGRIATEEGVRLSADNALAGRSTVIEAQLAGTTASGINTALGGRITTEEGVRLSADNALASRATSIETEITNARNGGASLKARIDTVESTAASSTSAVAGRTTTLEAQMTGSSASGLKALVTTEESARVAADSSAATRITSVEAVANKAADQEALNKNSTFAIWPTGQALPDNIGSFGSGLTVSKGAGKVSQNSITLEVASGANQAGIEVAWSTPNWNGRLPVVYGQRNFWVIEYKIEIGTPNLGTSGLRFLLTDATGATASAIVQPLLTSIHPTGSDDQIIEGSYFFECNPTVATSFYSARLAFFARNAALANYGRYYVHRLKVRPATPADISAGFAVPALTARVVTTESAISNAGNLDAWWQVQAIAGSALAGIRAKANSTGGSQIAMIADSIALFNTVLGVAQEVFTASGGNIFIKNKLTLGALGEIVLDPSLPAVVWTIGAAKLVIGKLPNDSLILWFGPSMAVGSMTKSNATIWADTNGNAYFGGSIIAGTLSNSRQGTDTSIGATTTVGPFATNGNPIAVVWGYTFTRTGRQTAGAPAPANPTATIRLYRTIAGGGETLIDTMNVTGSTNILQNDASDFLVSEQMSGSSTFTDTAGGTAQRTFRVEVYARTTGSRPGSPIGITSVSQRYSIVTSEN